MTPALQWWLRAGYLKVGGVTMRPYYQDEYVTIYHGDCREIAPEHRVDLLLTDPPYGIDEKGVGYGRRQLGCRTIAGDDTPELLLWACGLGARVLHPDRWALVFSDWTHIGAAQAAALAAGLDIKTVGVWDKQRPGLGRPPREQFEMLLIARKGKPRTIWTRGNVWRVPGLGQTPGRILHPHQKPERLMLALVDAFSEVGATVLDPFMGSGTTLVAAKSLGRRAIGIEIEERYCEIAAQRLSQGVLDFGGVV